MNLALLALEPASDAAIAGAAFAISCGDRQRNKN
jgi:hypothetical protein